MSEELRIHCNQCLRLTRHGELRTFEEFKPNGESILWQIVQCNGCEAISFYQVYTTEVGEGVWEITEFNAFPLRQFRLPKQFIDVPAKLDQLYRETIDAFNSSSLLFCAGGLRALVEGICAHQGVTDGPKFDLDRGEFETKRGSDEIVRGTNLQCKIEGLAEKNILTVKRGRTLHEHRYLGNKALHELDPPSKDTLEVAIGIIEHLMEELFSLEAQVEDLREFCGIKGMQKFIINVLLVVKLPFKNGVTAPRTSVIDSSFCFFQDF